MSLSDVFKTLKEISEMKKEIEKVKEEYYDYVKPLIEEFLKPRLNELIEELKRLNKNIEQLNNILEKVKSSGGR
jgi:phage host-nuclease inhibitor protein Gam